MNSKQKYLLIFGIIAIAILFYGLYLIYSTTPDIASNEEFSIETTGTPIPNVEIEKDVLNLNAKPQFKVGKTYKYRTTSLVGGSAISSNDIYSVENIENVDGKKCYKIVDKRDIISESGRDVQGEIIYHIDVESGDILDAIMDAGGTKTIIKGKLASAMGTGMYHQWMLALQEGFKWEQKANMSVKGMMKSVIVEYAIIGSEKVNDIDCFKVEIKNYLKMPNQKEIVSKQIMWVDKKERIMIKSKTTSEGLTISETEML